ncbi:17504_t:CDS:2, partial [Racocetra fulgida]
MLTANATEIEKLKPIVIGSSIEPHALARLNYDTLPITYRSNLKAWMRSDIFGEWLTELDKNHYNPNEPNENNDPVEDNDSNNSNEDISKSDEESNSEEEELETRLRTLFDVAMAAQGFKNVKTGILLALSGDEIEGATLALQDLADFEKDENDELIIDQTANSLDLTIECDASDTDDEPPEVPVVEGLN